MSLETRLPLTQEAAEKLLTAKSSRRTLLATGAVIGIASTFGLRQRAEASVPAATEVDPTPTVVPVKETMMTESKKPLDPYRITCFDEELLVGIPEGWGNYTVEDIDGTKKACFHLKDSSAVMSFYAEQVDPTQSLDEYVVQKDGQKKQQLTGKTYKEGPIARAITVGNGIAGESFAYFIGDETDGDMYRCAIWRNKSNNWVAEVTFPTKEQLQDNPGFITALKYLKSA